MDLGEILSRAWKTIWKHKILWLFGILAGCGATTTGNRSNGVNFEFNVQNDLNSARTGTWDAPTFLSPSLQRTFEDFFQVLGDVPVWVWIVIVLAVFIAGIIFSVLFLMAGTLGTTGVIKGTSMADEADEDVKPLSFGEIFRGLKPHYWKVFLFNIGYRAAVFIATFILVIPIIILAACTCGLGLLLLIPVGWFLAVMVYFTNIAMIEEGLGIFDAIKRAWQVVTKRLGYVVLMFLILGIGRLIAGLIVSLPLLISFTPLMINLLATGFENLTTGFVISAVLFLGAIPLTIVLSGVLNAYVLASWTLTYRRLTAEEDLSPTLLTEEVEE